MEKVKGKQRSGHRQLRLAIKLVLEQTPINPPTPLPLQYYSFHPLLPFSVNIHTIPNYTVYKPNVFWTPVACQRSCGECEVGDPSSNLKMKDFC